MDSLACNECGHEIEDTGPLCDRCCAPLRPSAPLPSARTPRTEFTRAESTTWPWDRLAPLAIVFLLTFSMILAGFQGRSHIFERQLTDPLSAAFAIPGEAPRPAAAPRWSAEPAESDDDCSVLGGLLGYCVRVHCTVANAGNAGGAAVIVATLESAVQKLTRSSRLYLAPGQKERVTFAFREATATYRARARCDIRSATA